MRLTAERIITIAKALSDKTRMSILCEIAGRRVMTCGETERVARLSQPTVSHHIKILFEAGLLTARKNGRHINLSVNRKLLKDFGRHFADSTGRLGFSRRVEGNGRGGRTNSARKRKQT